ncbi:NTPase KAP family P-loop domain-containing protein 1-like [Erythrolamprus reginae]|uniref:NTPase KAP family P-loop domain-containing protein 1-like n=1 Tax=Erythrolamprus reginae TaxID=121349 RepID=UPI00396CD5AF
MSNYKEEIAGLPHMQEHQKVGGLHLYQEAQDAGGYFPFLFSFLFHSSDLLREEDIYCSSLLKTLHHTSTPVTVGFYSSHKTRVHSLMDQIAGRMLEESIGSEESPKSRLLQRMTLLWYIVFYQPVVTEMHLERQTTEFLFIRFSAWEYACSNQLWAGLVTSLCDHIRQHFGALPLSLYHVVGSGPDSSTRNAQEEWSVKRKTCCIVGGIAVFTLLAVAGLVAAAVLVPGIRDGTLLNYLGGGLLAILWSEFIIAFGPVIKHLIISQKKKIERMTKDEKFTSHLGFRSAVKSEIEALIGFVYYMEIFQRRRLRIVFQITCLDICNPEQVVGVLNAINTLLSDVNAPFIFMLVVDPSNIVSCLEQSSGMKGMADNGYLYLNRTVTLPFSIPEIANKCKMDSLKDILKHHEALANGKSRRDMPLRMEEDQPKIDAMAEQYIHEAFRCLKSEQDCLFRYVPDSIIQMRRIVNTIPVTIRLMTQQHLLRHNLCPLAVASWIVLANQWPCRLSWILQCVEDKLEGQPPNNYEKESMWNVFVDTCPELFSKHKELENIMALDGDPKLFKKFLCKFPFTVQDGEKYLKYTVNLDHSIRRKIRQLQALAILENYSRSGTCSEKRT